MAGSEIDVQSLLVRAWWRSSDTVREMLEQLVVERLALLEARALGVRVEPVLVDARVGEARALIAERAAASGHEGGFDEFVRARLGLDPEFYAEQLRGDAIIQLLLERSVRSFSLAAERSVVRILAVRDRDALQGVEEGLAAGRSFAELVELYGQDDAAEPGGTRLVVVHDERVPLARIARQTPVGAVGGPVEEAGRFLMLQVEERAAPYAGAPADFQAAVEADLAARPVEDLEYIQWRAAMGRRYEIDLAPFAELVEGRRERAEPPAERP